jgi:hypothetical protein
MRQLLSESHLSRAQSARTLDLSSSTPVLLSPGRKSMSRMWSGSDLLSTNQSMNQLPSNPQEIFSSLSLMKKSTSFPDNLMNSSIFHNIKQSLPNPLHSSVSSSANLHSSTNLYSSMNGIASFPTASAQEIQTMHALSMYYQHFNGLQVCFLSVFSE